MKTETLNRRNFLKKAAYVAPAVVALGSLSAPQSAHASLIPVSRSEQGPFKQFTATTSGHYDNVNDNFSDLTTTVIHNKSGKTLLSDNLADNPGYNSNLFVSFWKKVFGIS